MDALWAKKQAKKYTNLKTLPLCLSGINEDTINPIYDTTGNVVDLLKIGVGTATLNGITLTVDADGVITVTGTATANTYIGLSDGFALSINWRDMQSRDYELPNDTYTFKPYAVTETGEPIKVLLKNLTVDANLVSIYLSQTSSLAWSTNWGKVYLYCANGKTYNSSFKLALLTSALVQDLGSGYSESSIPSAATIIHDDDFYYGPTSKRYIMSDVYGSTSVLKTTVQNKKLYVMQTSGRLYVYKKVSNDYDNKYLRFTFKHFTDEARICDVWKLERVYLSILTDGVFTDVAEIVTAGEWECAIKVNGADDFIGGYAHGYEMLDSISIFVDGKPITPTESGNYYCDEIRAIEKSTLYSRADGTTVVATHHKLYTINFDEITVNQKLVYPSAVTLDTSYLAMLPILQTFTPQEYDNERLTLYNCADSDGQTRLYNNDRYTLLDSNSGFSVDVQISDRKNIIAGSFSYIWHKEDLTENKIYFAYCGDAYSCAQDEIWMQISKYKFRYC